MKIVLTGAEGFLGWHTRLRLHALSDHEVIPVGRKDWPRLASVVANADAVLHLAGVNRADSEDTVRTENVRLAIDLGGAITKAERPIRVVYANSVQAGNGTPYGEGKKISGQLLAEATAQVGGRFIDVLLPNIFGEHGRPQYNSFVATFVHATVAGEGAQINNKHVGLLHAQDAAQALLDGLSSGHTQLNPLPEDREVQEVWDLLQEFHFTYMPTGQIPDLSSKFRIDLFNAYRTALFPKHYPIRLVPHTDARGSFVETVRCRGGQGQTSFSTTIPRATRGEHYHLSKIERFAVIHGTAVIELRRMFATEILSFEVNGNRPVAIDMPVGWVHNITNTGGGSLFTQFWSHDLFRADAPDTFAEPVRPKEHHP